jgi:hypothetical protein
VCLLPAALVLGCVEGRGLPPEERFKCVHGGSQHSEIDGTCMKTYNRCDKTNLDRFAMSLAFPCVTIDDVDCPSAAAQAAASAELLSAERER